MTTFEILVLVVLDVIVLAALARYYVLCKALDRVIANQNIMRQELNRIELNTHNASTLLQYHITPDIETISNNFLHLIDESKGLPAIIEFLDDLAINVKGNYNTLEGQQEDFAYIRKRINHVLELMHPAHEVINPPCYAPNSICMNFSGDCIDCPKRGDGGTWSTRTNINKED